MAAPVRASTTITTGSDTDAATGNLPATINAGDRLLALVVIDSAGADPISSTATDSTTDNWTEVLGSTIFTGTTGATGYAFALFEKIADGDEGGGTLAFTHSGAVEDFCIIVTRHTGVHASQALEVSAVAESADATPDPPPLTASWGAEDNSFISYAVGNRINTGEIPAAPTGYTFDSTKGNDWDASALDSGGAAIGMVADKGVTATAADDPSAWDTQDPSGMSSAFVAVLRPTAGGSPSADLSGTLADGGTEAEIVAGGETIIITLTNDTWPAAGASFDAQRQAIIDGLVAS